MSLIPVVGLQRGTKILRRGTGVLYTSLSIQTPWHPKVTIHLPTPAKFFAQLLVLLHHGLEQGVLTIDLFSICKLFANM